MNVKEGQIYRVIKNHSTVKISYVLIVCQQEESIPALYAMDSYFSNILVDGVTVHFDGNVIIERNVRLNKALSPKWFHPYNLVTDPTELTYVRMLMV